MQDPLDLETLTYPNVRCACHPLCEHCRITFTIQISHDPSVSHLIATGHVQYSPDDLEVWRRDNTPSSKKSPGNDARPSSHPDPNQISEETIDELCECADWAEVRINERGFQPNPPCYCRSLWAYQCKAVPRCVLEPAYGITNLQLILPDLYVTNMPDNETQTLCHTNIIHPEFKFTHHVNVVTGMDLPEYRFPKIGIMHEIRCHICSTKRLQLCISNTNGRRLSVSRLDSNQLAFARDFLSLALSYPHCPDRPFAKDTWVLVTTSRNCPIDAMVIVTCYLAYASGYGISHIARYFNCEESIQYSWLSCLNRSETIELVDEGVMLE